MTTNQFVCPKCGAYFNNTDQLIEHHNQAHPLKEISLKRLFLEEIWKIVKSKWFLVWLGGYTMGYLTLLLIRWL